MARDVESLEPDRTEKRNVGRTILNWFLLLASIAVLAGWAFFGFYQLEPGEHAVILQFGRYSKTVTSPGLKWHLPPPIESHDVVTAESIEREQFGFPTQGEPTTQQRDEGTVQTSDNNLVNIGFVVQYRIKDAFFSRYRVASPRETLRDTAEAAIREVIGRNTVDGVLSEKRGDVQRETRSLLQEILDRYESGLVVTQVELQEVQPPPEVQDSFEDVVSAKQDRDRAVNEAEGYANEVLPDSRAEAARLREAAQGYRDAKIAQATGDAARFTALLAEYRKAPEVTRKRLYLETMEEVLPGVDKVVIEPGTANLMPFFPLGRGQGATPAPPRVPGAGGDGARPPAPERAREGE